MKYTTLGRTGVQVSRLCLGCMNFGGRTVNDLQYLRGYNFVGHDLVEPVPI